MDWTCGKREIEEAGMHSGFWPEQVERLVNKVGGNGRSRQWGSRDGCYAS